MNFTVLKTKISVSPLFFAVLTAFLIMDKNGIASYVVLFSLLHESGHFLALLCVKGRAKEIKISPFGIEMTIFENMSTVKKLAVLTAGFAVNFILAFLFFTAEKMLFGYINLVIGCLTALPIAATDGGSVLGIILEKAVPKKAEKIFFAISLSVTLVIAGFIFSAAVLFKNHLLFFAVIYMVMTLFK